MGCLYSCMGKSSTNGAIVRDGSGEPVAAVDETPLASKPPVDTPYLQITIDSQQDHVVTCNNTEVDDSSRVMNLYNRYVNPEMGQISAEGIEQLCSDLELDPEDFRVLVLAYSFGAQIMCRFTEEEFVKGCEKHGITSIDSMKQTIPKLLNAVETSFAEFYHWTYKFALDIESGQRTLPTDMAVSLWRLVFQQNYPSILDRWLEYLETCANVKGISKDTWDMFLIFVEQIGDNLKAYDDSEAWPSLLDDFVERELAKKDLSPTSVVED